MNAPASTYKTQLRILLLKLLLHHTVHTSQAMILSYRARLSLKVARSTLSGLSSELRSKVLLLLLLLLLVSCTAPVLMRQSATGGRARFMQRTFCKGLITLGRNTNALAVAAKKSTSSTRSLIVLSCRLNHAPKKKMASHKIFGR